MTKKRKAPPLEELLERPWCYYCERDFDDLKILISHQKAKHLKCSLCPRRLATAGGLSVHMQQVHKENLTMIENALPGREDPLVEIFGMEGIPQDIASNHRDVITQNYYASGGRSGGGQSENGQPSKKAKVFETPEEIKKRLAEHKAKKAAGLLDAANAPNTPGGESVTPQNAQVESRFQMPGASPPNPFNPHFTAAPAGSPPGPFNHPFGQPPGPFPPQYSPPNPGYGMSGPPQPNYPSFQGAPPPGAIPQYPVQPFQPPFPGPPPPSNGYGRGFGPVPNNAHMINNGNNHHQHQQHHNKPSDAQKAGPPRNNSLPSAPGLPARPTFDAPPVSRSKMHELHQGHKVQESKANYEASALSSGIDDLIAQQQVGSAHGNDHANGMKEVYQESKSAGDRVNDVDTIDRHQPAAAPTPALADEKAVKTSEKTNDSKSAKTKKKLNLVVKDHHTSPEEKMARMSRYSFTPR
ncbi:hypothetical protein CAC42_1434 [Sphaceloma murrayae]|uniref:BED-type domain-containing protein n=1 Tax=Sphaceloma murrayae TaxID=2082308 RepID=A0A2K1QGG6_9PEZI|nr:hypothetical protein CAC42_1434 [Sphaceloma murrayae]